MTGNQTISRPTVIFLIATVIVVWGYIAFRIESVASVSMSSESTPNSVGLGEKSPELFQGDVTYIADFTDPFTIPSADTKASFLPAIIDQQVNQSTVETPRISLLGTIGNSAIVVNDDMIPTIHSLGDSVAAGVIATVNEEAIELHSDDSLMTFTIPIGTSKSFNLSKPE